MSKKIVYVIILALLSSLLFVTNSFASDNQKTSAVIYGDLNGDGEVNSLDYTLMKRYVLGSPKLKKNILLQQI